MPIKTGGAKQLIYTAYKNRIVSWSDYFAAPESNIWHYLNTTEDEAVVQEANSENPVKHFSNFASNLKAYALTEIEFNELVPMLKEGSYVLFIERWKEN